MCRAEIQWLASGPTLKLEGKLVADWAEQARCLVTKDVLPKGLIVDLSGLSYIDSVGEQLLKWLDSGGALFVAGSVYAIAVCDRLRLSPMQRISQLGGMGITRRGPQLGIPIQLRPFEGGPRKRRIVSWFRSSPEAVDARTYASPAEIVACFQDQRNVLGRLAFLITGDQATADRSVVQTCEMTLQGNSPFRDWLFEWAKAATIAGAISPSAEAIRFCEAAYKDRRCSHVEHLSQGDAEERAVRLDFILGADAQELITELDPLCRAVLVLRVAIRSSIQDCALRLNVSRAAVLGANCHVLTWLQERHVKPVEENRDASHAV